MTHFKTNAMRILERSEIPYRMLQYETSGTSVPDAVTVAALLSRSPKEVFKTLVTQGTSGQYYIFLVPADATLDFKAAAQCVAEKSVEMIRLTDIARVTGYVRGGCSPIGMRKVYRTVIDSSCQELESMIFSAGKIGYQVEMSPNLLLRLIDGQIASIVLDPQDE